MQSHSPGQAGQPPIFQIRSPHNISTSSLRPVLSEPVVCSENIVSHPREEYPNYRRNAARMLGVIQLICGMLCMLLNIGMAIANYNDAWRVAAGWWASPFMIFAGTFALSSSKIVNKVTVHATLWLSLLSSFLTIAVIVEATMALLLDRVCGMCIYDPGQETAHFALSSFFMFFGVVEFTASIVQFVISCQAVCVPQRPQSPFDDPFGNFGIGTGSTNSQFPPPPPPYDAESHPVPEQPSYGSPVSDPTILETEGSFYLPSYEESVQKS